MSLRAAMVLTTIADPVVLDGYCDNFTSHGHLDEVQVIVIPDRKTPPTVFQRCVDLRKKGLDVLCPTLDEQERILLRLGFPPRLVPYNSDNRRNVGYLMAADSEADFLMSIDDDNYCPANEDYFAEHSIVCREPQRYDVVDSSTAGSTSANCWSWNRPAASTRADSPTLRGNGSRQSRSNRARRMCGSTRACG